MTVDIETFLHEEVAAAVEDITILSKKDPPLNPLGQIHPKAVAAARVLADPSPAALHRFTCTLHVPHVPYGARLTLCSNGGRVCSSSTPARSGSWPA